MPTARITNTHQNLQQSTGHMNFIHESIFVSSLRAFSKTIFVILGAAIGLFAITITAGVFSSPYVDPFRPQLVICPDENGNSQLLPNAPVILKVSIEGMIGTKKLNTDTVTQALLRSKQVIKPEKIKGIFLSINSPGGTTIDSSGIYQALLDFKEQHKVPVYCFVDGLCASGGMYIACASDYIASTSESVIGSVGVRMGPIFNYMDLMAKIGVNALTLTQGKDKDSFNPFRSWSPSEGEDIKNLIKESYDSFVDIVTKSRTKINRDSLVNIYGAQIYSAKTAAEYGYIDMPNYSYNKTLKDLREKCGIDAKQSYQVLEVTAYKSPLEDLFDSKFKFFSKSFKEQVNDFETRNPICDRFFYLMDF